ncbi:MAG: D-alanyl-D-alanine carboxypeptidase [Treponema sp.]|nr:D-alanyl-D-alanine carboxypeptidase [Treponema sp.]
MSRKIILLLLAITLPACLFAQIFSTPQELIPYLEDAPEIISRAAVLIDAETGTLLYSKNPDVLIPPASLTKLMTMRLLMKAIDEGKIFYDDLVEITVESWAQSQPRNSSLMFLEPGQIVTVREIMLGMSIPSGNDAAVAAALHLAPTMADFVEMMMAEARRMGMYTTRFTESSGISSRNRTTAAEYALFCRQYLELHPESLREFHSVKSFTFPLSSNMPANRRSGYQTYTQSNPNTLLNTFEGVDGLKTGYIGASGYNIALTGIRDQTRLILVLLGAPASGGGARLRSEESTLLLSWAFDNFKTVRPVIDYSENSSLFKAQLWKGKEDEVTLMLAESENFTSPLNRGNSLQYETVIDEILIAPLAAGTQVGYLLISDEYGVLSKKSLVTAAAYEKGGFFKRIWHSIKLYFWKQKTSKQT